MRTLETQIRQLAEIAEGAMPWIDPDEIQMSDVARVVPPPSDESARPGRRVVAVAAAFVLVLALIGSVAWLAPFGEDSAPIDEPTTTTQPPNPTVAMSPDLSETLALLDDVLANGPVYRPWGSEITAELQFLYGYLQDVAGSSFSPEPEFDTSSLGVELRLVDLPLSALGYNPSGGDEVTKYPLLVGVHLEGTAHAAISHISISFFTEGTVLTECSIDGATFYKGVLSPVGGGAGGCSEGVDEDGAEIGISSIVNMDGGVSALFPTLIGGLPPEASVVATTLGDGTKVWQRPHLGTAIFADPTPRCVASEGSPICDIEIIVLNAKGIEILRMNASGDPRGFTLSPP